MNVRMENELLRIIREELVLALGCTEPIAIAFAAAKVRRILGKFPQSIAVSCSSNVIKNAKSVYVPMTNGLKGIEAAALVGLCGGDPDLGLQVLNALNETDLAEARRLLAENFCQVRKLETPVKLDILVEAFSDEHSAAVRVTNQHTHISFESFGDQVLIDHLETDLQPDQESEFPASLDEVYEFCLQSDLTSIADLLQQQAMYNQAIAEEGLKSRYGINAGQMILELFGDSIENQAIAKAAAASDARMGGCDMPVMINSGSGNQGITVTVPVLEYARHLKVSTDKLNRALALSNLVAIYQKTAIGRLSAYCGAVNAASGAAAGITYLQGGNKNEVFCAIEHVLGTMSGLVCDGAKASCAGKIAASVNSAVLGSKMCLAGREYEAGDGIVKETPVHTIKGVVKLAKEGMRETDEVIVDIMMDTSGKANR